MIKKNKKNKNQSNLKVIDWVTWKITIEKETNIHWMCFALIIFYGTWRMCKEYWNICHAFWKWELDKERVIWTKVFDNYLTYTFDKLLQQWKYDSKLLVTD